MPSPNNKAFTGCPLWSNAYVSLMFCCSLIISNRNPLRWKKILLPRPHSLLHRILVRLHLLLSHPCLLFRHLSMLWSLISAIWNTMTNVNNIITSVVAGENLQDGEHCHNVWFRQSFHGCANLTSTDSLWHRNLKLRLTHHNKNVAELFYFGDWAILSTSF